MDVKTPAPSSSTPAQEEHLPALRLESTAGHMPAPGSWLTSIKRHLPLLLILLVAFCLLTINVNVPWGSIHEDNGLMFSSIAINHIRFGLAITKGQDLVDTLHVTPHLKIVGVPPSQEFHFLLTGKVEPHVYGDHPPLLGLTIAGAFEVFGYDYWVVRLIPIAYSLATLIVFYVLAARLFDLGVARLASFLYATFPMMAYFGRDVAHEAPTLFWGMLLLTGSIHWRHTSQVRWLVLMIASIVIGGCYGWPEFYFAGIVFIIDWLASRRLDRKLALATVVPALLTFLLVFAQIAWALNGNLRSIGNAFVLRTLGTHGDIQTQITPLNWFTTIALWNLKGYGIWPPFLLPFVAGFLIKRARKEGWSLRMRVLAITFLFGLSHVLIFHQGAFVHVYWQFYFLPFYALSLGWAIQTFVRRYLPRLRWPALALMGAGVCALNLPIIIGFYTSISGVFVPLFGLLT